MIRFSDSIAIKAPVEEVYALIADFERYPRFVKEVKSAEVITAKGSRTRVKFCVNMVKDVSYTLDITLAAPRTVSWTQVEADMIKSQKGAWSLTALDKHLTDAKFTVDIEFPFWVPTSIAEAGIKAAMPNMMKSFKKEAESQTGGVAKKAMPQKKGLAAKKKSASSRK